jgi:hypothetical protein
MTGTGCLLFSTCHARVLLPSCCAAVLAGTASAAKRSAVRPRTNALAFMEWSSLIPLRTCIVVITTDTTAVAVLAGMGARRVKAAAANTVTVTLYDATCVAGRLPLSSYSLHHGMHSETLLLVLPQWTPRTQSHKGVH